MRIPWYLVRWYIFAPMRWSIRTLAEIVSCVPGTTNGEVAEMHRGPCQRCVGRSVKGPAVD